MSVPAPIEQLAAALARLPGIGRRSALRIAFRVAKSGAALADPLIQGLVNVRDAVALCPVCGNFMVAGSESCSICADSARDGSCLCVVEDPGDVLLFEESGVFRGRYHVLMGRISPRRQEGADNPRMAALRGRVQSGISEVVLALNTDVEGDATMAYLEEFLAGLPVKITRLGSGLPTGSGISFVDPATLARAIQGRGPTD